MLRGAEERLSAPALRGSFGDYSTASHLSLRHKVAPRGGLTSIRQLSGGAECPDPVLMVSTYTLRPARAAPPVPTGAERPTKSSYVAQRHMALPGRNTGTPSSKGSANTGSSG